MDSQKSVKRLTVNDLKGLYLKGQKITAVTAYDYTMARLVDEAGVDIILVGDSLGMVVQGHKTTLNVEMSDMLYHTRSVSSGVARAHVMADMPFLSYQASHEDAIRNAGNLLKAGAQSIKIEGGEEIADLVWYMNKVGIPVVGHIGLKPQSIHRTGGYRIQGKNKVEGDEIFNDAQALEEAGAFALLLEGIPLELAAEITKSINIPTIGIGSGVACSGQVQVLNDLLGMDAHFKPRHAKAYADLYTVITEAVKSYNKDVQEEKFPDESQTVHRNLVEVK